MNLHEIVDIARVANQRRNANKSDYRDEEAEGMYRLLARLVNPSAKVAAREKGWDWRRQKDIAFAFGARARLTGAFFPKEHDAASEGYGWMNDLLERAAIQYTPPPKKRGGYLMPPPKKRGVA